MSSAHCAHEINDGHYHKSRRNRPHTRSYAPPLLEATTSPPEATTTNRNVPQISAKMRRHSRAWSGKSVDNCRRAIRCRCATPALFPSDFILAVPVLKGSSIGRHPPSPILKRSLIEFHHAEGVRFVSNFPERETAGWSAQRNLYQMECDRFRTECQLLVKFRAGQFALGRVLKNHREPQLNEQNPF